MVNNIYNTEGGYILSKKHPYYDHYRELAFLYLMYFMSGKSSVVLMNKTKVKKKMLEIFPEEKNFEDLLRISQVDGSIEQNEFNLNITDLGIETATRLSDPIKTEISNAFSS